MASVLELILRSVKQGTAAKKTADELKQLQKESKKTEAATKKLNIAMLAVKGAVMTAGVAFLKSIPDILNQGLAIDRAEVALIAYAGSAEEATRTIDLMKDATGGAMSRMSAMQNATRMLSMGLASNADEAANLTKIAVTLGSTMGKGPQAAIEDFTLMLANQSILRLDTFGISGANVRERMKELADQGFAPADRQLRFLTATMEMAEGKMTALDEAGFEATSNVDRLKATIEDLKAGAITWIADGLMPWIDGLYALKDAHAAHEETIIRSTSSYQDYIAEYERINSGLPVYAQSIGALTEAEWAASRATDAMTVGKRQYASAADIATTASNNLAEANRSVALSLGDITAATLAKDALDALTTAHKEGAISEDEYKAGFIEITGALTDMTSEQVATQLRIFELNQDLAGGETDAEGYAAGLLDVANAMDLIKDKHVTLTVDVVYEKGEGYIGFQHGGSFIVRGPPGPDRVPVRFMATSGERVTVTPPGDTIHQEDQRQTNLFQGAQMNFNRPMDEDVLLEQIRRIAS